MKKAISFMLSLVMVFSCGVSSYAGFDAPVKECRRDLVITGHTHSQGCSHFMEQNKKSGAIKFILSF